MCLVRLKYWYMCKVKVTASNDFNHFNKCTFAAKWNFCIYFLFSLRFSLFQGLPSSAFNVFFFVIRSLLFSLPSLILIAAWWHSFQYFKLWILLSDFHVLWPACHFSFWLLALNILKCAWVVGFSMLHLRFGIRLSVFNFQLLAVGIKSSDYRLCHSASGF